MANDCWQFRLQTRRHDLTPSFLVDQFPPNRASAYLSSLPFFWPTQTKWKTVQLHRDGSAIWTLRKVAAGLTKERPRPPEVSVSDMNHVISKTETLELCGCHHR